MPMSCGHSFYMEGSDGRCVLCEDTRIRRELNRNLTRVLTSLEHVSKDLSLVADHLPKPKRDGLK